MLERKRCGKMNRKVLIDGDGCPVVKSAVEIAKEYGIVPLIFCDTAHILSYPDVEVIIVTKGMDAVDFALINQLNKGDIVLTQDYGLAAMALAKNSYVINQNGFLYTNENIDTLLHTRYVNKKIRNSGGKIKGPRKRKKEDNVIFEESFRELCLRIRKEWDGI